MAAVRRAETTLFALDTETFLPSAFGYNEAQLRFHEGNAYTHLHDSASAYAFQQRALSLCPERDFLDRTLIQLDTAACLIHDREVEEALHIATNALLSLSDEQRQGLLLMRSNEVLRSLPRSQQTLPAARGFRDLLLTATKGES